MVRAVRTRLSSPVALGTAVAAFLSITIASTASATIWNVYADSTGDAPTIHAAIDSAANGDTIAVGCGDYYGSKVFYTPNVTILGVAGDSTCVRLHFPFEFYFDNRTDFVSLTFSTGSYLEVGYEDDLYRPDVSADRCVFDSARVALTTGASFRDCVFQNNLATDGGAVAGYDEGAGFFDRCIFRNNHATEGGGAVYRYLQFGDMFFQDCLFEDNTSDGRGGAAYADLGGRFQFVRCTFVNNVAALDGGAVAARRARPRLTECLLVDNHAGRNGGAVSIDTTFAQSSTKNSLLWNCTLYGNSADSLGGGIYNDDYEPVTYDGKLWILNTIIAGTVAGEAIHTVDQPPTILCTDIFGNAGGDWTGPLADSLAVNGNFSLAPKFCDAAAGNFDLKPTSPCLDAPGCGLVGFSGAECAVSPPTGVADGAETGADGMDRGDFLLATPNPFRGDVTLRFAAPAASEAELVVFDLGGREIARAPVLVGARSVTWDGRDGSGRAVSPGVYFLQLSDGGRSQTAKITLLR